MDALYRGLEASLLALGFALALAAFTAMALPHPLPPASAAVTLPMVSVTADPAIR
ncbi:hypothetical protein [Methylobacterium sp. A54F]